MLLERDPKSDPAETETSDQVVDPGAQRTDRDEPDSWTVVDPIPMTLDHVIRELDEEISSKK